MRSRRGCENMRKGHNWDGGIEGKPAVRCIIGRKVQWGYRAQVLKAPTSEACRPI